VPPKPQAITRRSRRLTMVPSLGRAEARPGYPLPGIENVKSLIEWPVCRSRVA